MQNSQQFTISELAYAPLPEAAHNAAVDSIIKCGFSRDAILEEYKFSSVNVKVPVKLNALAFAHSIHRNPGDYASLTLYNAVNGLDDEAIVSILAESASPFHLIHRHDQFSFWASTVSNNKPKPIHLLSNISYNQLANALSDYAPDLGPQRIIDVKLGRDTFSLPMLRQIQPVQLSLWAADITRPLLVDHFAQAVNWLRRYVDQEKVNISDETITSFSIQLLGAIILADTGVLDDDTHDIRRAEVSIRELLERASSRFPRYFQPELLSLHEEVVEQAYAILRQIRYAGFVPEMLTSIYGAAFSKAQRKKLGRYDTPLYLTRRIWENIPVEYLPPQQRHVVDMTCGWGSFLIAGHERLAELSDSPLSLREYLHGNDIDYSTSQLAGLGLLLSQSEDSWHVDHGDALKWSWLETRQPNIIVGNPPFGSQRDSSITDTASWYEEANRYLAHAIERLAPNGYLAMLMPRSFTSSVAARDLRKQLLEQCDILEMWELPIKVFSEATATTIVIFAQKNGSQHNPTKLRTVQPQSLRVTAESGAFTFTASSLFIDQSAWKNTNTHHMMDYQIILPEYTWRTIHSHSMNLQEVAEVIRGAIRGKKPENRHWTDYPDPKQVSWLTGVKHVMPYPHSFDIDYSQATTIAYPNDLERPRLDKEHILSGTKVLVVYDPNPSWGKRNKLAIERKHHYPSDSFWVVAPNALANQQGITCEVLAAVLNWNVSNAWIIEHLKSPAIPKRAMDTIPFPKYLSKHDCQMLTQAVQEIEEAVLHNLEAPTNTVRMIDTILKRAYHLDDTTFERLRKVAEWDSKPQLTLDIQPNAANADWMLSGIVKSVQAEEGTLTLWMEGFHDLQTVQIVPSMPGWILRSGAAFRTKIPALYLDNDRIDPDNVDWGQFRPQPYTYMSEEELLTEFSQSFA